MSKLDEIKEIANSNLTDRLKLISIKAILDTPEPVQEMHGRHSTKDCDAHCRSTPKAQYATMVNHRGKRLTAEYYPAGTQEKMNDGLTYHVVWMGQRRYWVPLH